MMSVTNHQQPSAGLVMDANALLKTNIMSHLPRPKPYQSFQVKNISKLRSTIALFLRNVRILIFSRGNVKETCVFCQCHLWFSFYFFRQGEVKFH